MRFSHLFLPLALSLSAQGFAWADSTPASPPVAPAATPEPVDDTYEMPKVGWDKDGTGESDAFTSAFTKFLVREENTAKNALAAAVMAMPDHNPAHKLSLLKDPHDPFMVAKRKAALALKAQYPPEFWAWLHQRQDIRMGLFLTTHPTPPQYVANLAYLWKAVGAKNADKYAHLLLAASLSATPVNAAPAPPAPPPASPIEQRLAQLIASGSKEVPEPLVFFLHHKDKFAEAANLPEAQVDAANPATLARLLHTYPDPGSISVADNTVKLIARLEANVPDFKDGLAWPLFHVEKAPYYLLNPLAAGAPAAEQDFIWNLFVNPARDPYTGKITGRRMMGYGKYGWEYTAPEVAYKKSAWHPNSWPRMLEDGGVCGRLAPLEAINRNTLGIPCCKAYQPAHCAVMSVGVDAKGRYFPSILQSVTGNWQNTTTMIPLGNTPSVAGLGHTAAGWLALTETANRVSPTNYYRSLFCVLAAQDMKNPAEKIQMLRLAVNLNPYHLGAWGQLAALSGQMGYASFNSVILGMADRLAYPDGPPPKKAADKDAAQGAKGPANAADKVAAAPAASEVPRDVTGDRIMRACVEYFLPSNYDRILGATAKNHDALVAGVHGMWHLMETLDDDGIMGGGDAVDAVFQKYAAQVNPDQAAQLFKANFEKALLGHTDVYGFSGGPLITVVNSFRDVGAKMPVGDRVAALKSICVKLASVSPKFRLGSWPTMLYGKTFSLSRVEPNRAYASALGQLIEALKANGQAELAQGTWAGYCAESEHMRRQGLANDRKNFKADVLAQIEKLREEDRKRL